MRQIIRKVLKENGLEAKPNVISQLAAKLQIDPNGVRTICKNQGKTAKVARWGAEMGATFCNRR
jgi:hypothetical protein